MVDVAERDPEELGGDPGESRSSRVVPPVPKRPEDHVCPHPREPVEEVVRPHKPVPEELPKPVDRHRERRRPGLPYEVGREHRTVLFPGNQQIAVQGPPGVVEDVEGAAYVREERHEKVLHPVVDQRCKHSNGDEDDQLVPRKPRQLYQTRWMHLAR